MAALAVLGLGGCADDGLPAAAPSTPPSGQVELTGDVVDGVEPGCMLLKTADNTLYLLLGGDRTVITGNHRVTVRGAPEPGMLTTCQQGIPFKVTEVHPT